MDEFDYADSSKVQTIITCFTVYLQQQEKGLRVIIIALLKMSSYSSTSMYQSCDNRLIY